MKLRSLESIHWYKANTKVGDYVWCYKWSFEVESTIEDIDYIDDTIVKLKIIELTYDYIVLECDDSHKEDFLSSDNVDEFVIVEDKKSKKPYLIAGSLLIGALFYWRLR